MGLTVEKVTEEHGGFRKERSCVAQISALKISVAEYSRKRSVVVQNRR